MMQGAGARPKVKKEEEDSAYALTSDVATEFRRASEHKARLKNAAKELAAAAGMSPSGPQRSAVTLSDAVTSGRCDDAGHAQTVNKYGGAHHSQVPVKTPKYSGKTDWEAFHAQFELLSQAAGWSEGDKALQLALCLTEEASTCLLLLSPVERSDYGALVRALQRHYGHCEQPGLLRSELCGRRRQPGEPLRVLANDIETLSRRAYAHMPPAVQGELARDQFVQAITPRELRVQTQLAHPRTLQEALELALEREIVGAGTSESGLKGPVVRNAVESGPDGGRPAWVDEMTELIRAVALQTSRSDTQPRRRPLVCWGCGQTGHILSRCPKQGRGQGNDAGSV